MKNTVTVSKWAPFLPGFSYNSQFRYMPLNLHTHTLAVSHSEQSWVIYTQALATCTLTCRRPYKLWTRPEYPVHSAPSSTTAQLISLLLPRLHVLWLHSWDSPSLAGSTANLSHLWSTRFWLLLKVEWVSPTKDPVFEAWFLGLHF